MVFLSKFNYLITTSLLLWVYALNAQQKVKFTHLTTEDGLYSANIRAICQDFQQFIWLGTENGLHRYDGYEFKIYQRVEGDEKSIGGNFTMSLYEDSFNNLWVGTLDRGLSLYNRSEDNFYNFVHKPDDTTSIFGNTISSFYETSDHILWITTQQGGLSYIDLKTFDPEQPVFHNIPLPEHMIAKGWFWIRKIVPAMDGDFWLGGHGFGLLKFDPETKQFVRYLNDADKGPVLPDDRITNMYLDDLNRLWICTWGQGLFAYYPEDSKLINYGANGTSGGLPSDQIVEMAVDDEDGFWIGTDDGLCKMTDFSDQYPEGSFEVFKRDDFNANSLLTNSVKALFVDDRNRLWVGTYFGGVNIYDRDFFRFNTIKHHPLKKHSLPGNNVTAIAEDETGNFWIGTDNNGLCKLDKGDKNLGSYKYKSITLKNSINGNFEKKIKCLKLDQDGNLWIGTWGGGMFSYQTSTDEVRHYPYNKPGSLPSESVFAIAPDSLGNLWIGTFSGGLAYYNVESNEYKYYRYEVDDSTSIGNDKVNTVFIDSKHRVWVGTEGGGLNMYVPEYDHFRRIDLPHLKSSYNILSIFEDTVDRYWIGTHANGLLKYDHKDQRVKLFDERHRLTSKMIYAIVEDQHQNLWISTNEGLAKLAEGDTTFINYSRTEGLQSKQFNTNSVLVSKSGRLIFGGVNGMNAFYPVDISKNTFQPEVVFTDFWLDNVQQSVRFEGSPLTKNIIVTDQIDLTRNQNSFSVEYAALEYDFANRSQYMAYLEGFNHDWQHKGYERKVTYTNLNPGKYKLHVKAINKDGFVSDNAATLIINIVPAWYQTLLFKILVAIGLIGLVLLAMRIRVKFLLKQKKILEEKVVQRTNELNEKNNEVLAQNEELQAQNEQIYEQHEQLEAAKNKLQRLNDNLEKLVHERTEALEETVRKLSKSVYELDRFVYSASHDLSAPLKSILGLINVARMDTDPNRMTDYIDYIENSIHKLETVIASLVSFSRNSRLEVNNVPIGLRKLIEEVTNELAFLSSAININVQNNVPVDCIINSDRQRLTTILHNLISNAMKYSDNTKPDPLIEIIYNRDNGSHCIKILDNGIGIAPDQINKIFDMFHRATETSNGSGLGLYIVKETLSMLGGNIEVDSMPGKGTTFTIYLPVNGSAQMEK